MKILILNWRDIANPSGGGAEQLTHEMAKRWVDNGHQVYQYSSLFPNARKEEVINGIHFMRRGRWWSVHVFAFFYYLQNKKKFDIVIDEVHWFPFFSVLYAREKTIALTCEVATNLFYKIFPRPIALAFSLIEKLYLALYKNTPTMVISESTRLDLIKTGYNERVIIVIPMGLTLPNNLKLEKKEKNPTLISVGRLNIQKGTISILEAFSKIHDSFPNANLWLVGSATSEFRKEIENMLISEKIKNKVRLWGFVSEREKFSLMARAHILISASAQEGWGLTVPEAGFVNTPSVVYNIPGFRDIIIQNKTGILVNSNPNDLAKETIGLLQDDKKYKALQVAGQNHSKKYSWDKTAEVALQFIKSQIKT